MTFSERMVAGSIGGILLTLGGRIVWLLGGQVVVMALASLALLALGGVCLFGSLTLGDDDVR